ncbi:hypothetical protein FHR81_001995 [Actinoalloteichus hoggarensis]|uniref:Uncharacterized protein n=1 Tax=Actinoalloteichus hoggarensis TaxID=1470176 RepID=A0A221W5R0_9PSEU|nr:hypothetical protein AHOG_17000 [Actinoalloteichus hoggarensis]MBB5920957.1 hypothetical protein [Actinoalloteichus hoggarensis]
MQQGVHDGDVSRQSARQHGRHQPAGLVDLQSPGLRRRLFLPIDRGMADPQAVIVEVIERREDRVDRGGSTAQSGLQPRAVGTHGRVPGRWLGERVLGAAVVLDEPGEKARNLEPIGAAGRRGEGGVREGAFVAGEHPMCPLRGDPAHGLPGDLAHGISGDLAHGGPLAFSAARLLVIVLRSRLETSEVDRACRSDISIGRRRTARRAAPPTTPALAGNADSARCAATRWPDHPRPHAGRRCPRGRRHPDAADQRRSRQPSAETPREHLRSQHPFTGDDHRRQGEIVFDMGGHSGVDDH